MLRRTFLPLAVSATVLLGACGDDGADDTGTTDTIETDAGSESGGAGIEVSGDLDVKPEIELNGQAEVEELVVEDVVEGDGAEVQAGDTVTVQYVGVLLDGSQFDSSWDRGQPITFPLQGVIQGWQDGIPGMKEGGRRLLVIPGDQAYGPSGNQGIPPNATLVFVVDMISIG